MDEARVDDLAEQLVRELAQALTTPRPQECLACFVARMLEEFACDGTLRFARRFRDLAAPRATALERRLQDRGGFCDCEIFGNAYQPSYRLRIGDHEVLPCIGVRRGSTAPCGHWQQQARR